VEDRCLVEIATVFVSEETSIPFFFLFSPFGKHFFYFEANNKIKV